MKLVPSCMLITALLLALVVAACGGQGELTLEEYLQEVDTLGLDADAAVDAAGEEFDEAVDAAEDDEDIVGAFGDYVEAILSLGHEELEQLQKLDPPPEVEELHDSLVAPVSDALEWFDGWQVRGEGAESESDVVALFAELSEPEFVELSDRALEARCELQSIADDSGFDVEVGCEGLTLEQYFEELDTIISRSEVETTRRYLEFVDDLNDLIEPGEDLDDEEKALLGEQITQLYMSVLSDMGAIQEEMVSGLSELEPHYAAEDEHEELLAVQTAGLDAFNSAIDFAQSGADVEDVSFVLDEAVAGYFSDVFEACVKLQELADKHDIRIDLECSG